MPKYVVSSECIETYNEYYSYDYVIVCVTHGHLYGSCEALDGIGHSIEIRQLPRIAVMAGNWQQQLNVRRDRYTCIDEFAYNEW